MKRREEKRKESKKFLHVFRQKSFDGNLLKVSYLKGRESPSMIQHDRISISSFT